MKGKSCCHLLVNFYHDYELCNDVVVPLNCRVYLTAVCEKVKIFFVVRFASVSKCK
jgi:hypothetical protein